MKEFKAIIVILSLIPFEFLGIFTDYQTGLLLGYFPFVIIAFQFLNQELKAILVLS